MKQIGHRTNVRRNLFNHIGILFHAPRRIGAESRPFLLHFGNIHAHSSEQLPYTVVQFARYTSSFFVLKSKEARGKFAFLECLFALFLLRDVAIRFEKRVRIPVITLIKRPTASNYELRAVLALVNELAGPAPVAIKPLGDAIERFGELGAQ